MQPKTAEETDGETLERILLFVAKNRLTNNRIQELLTLVIRSTKNPSTCSIPTSTYLFRKMFGFEIKTSYSFATPCCDQIIHNFKSLKQIECPAYDCQNRFGSRAVINKSNYSFRYVICVSL